MKKINYSALKDRIEKRAAEDLAQNNIGGASVLVAQLGELVYKGSFGKASPTGEPVTDKTLFRLASMTKPVTAVAAMMLVERGLLSLDDKVEKFYPDFSRVPVSDGRGDTYRTDKKVTVRNILSHRSGIYDSTIGMTHEDISSVDSLAERLTSLPLSFVPGSKSSYNAFGAFSVLTGIIEKITDMPYEDYLNLELFSPLEMEDTTFAPSDEQWGRMITMHDKNERGVGRSICGCVFENFPVQSFLGGAGLASTLPDYYKFASMLARGGEYRGRRILSRSSVEEIRRPQSYLAPEEWWGLGVRVVTLEKRYSLSVGSFGWSGAYGTHFWIDPKNEIVGMYMKNSRYDGGSASKTGKNLEIDVKNSLT